MPTACLSCQRQQHTRLAREGTRRQSLESCRMRLRIYHSNLSNSPVIISGHIWGWCLECCSPRLQRAHLLVCIQHTMVLRANQEEKSDSVPLPSAERNEVCRGQGPEGAKGSLNCESIRRSQPKKKCWKEGGREGGKKPSRAVQGCLTTAADAGERVSIFIFSFKYEPGVEFNLFH